jgi:hypothetical protein
MTYLSRHRSIRNTPYRLREQGKCIKNKLQQKKRKLECAFLIILAVHKFQFIHALYNKLLIIALLLFKDYKSKKNIRYISNHFYGNNYVTFQGLDDQTCWHQLRFRKSDLWRVSESLLLPSRLILDNGLVTNNEEMLTILLYRLTSCDSWYVLEKRIGIEYSRMSRIFKVYYYNIFYIICI